MNHDNQQAAREWLPIESAPKDGTIILGCEWVSRDRGEHIVVEVEWSMWRSRWILSSCVWPDESVYADPTHWMPRPTPPDSGEK